MLAVSVSTHRSICPLSGGYADAGTFTAILGPSGAGKTTLLDCLSLRNKDFTGLLTLDGTPVRDALSALGGRSCTSCTPAERLGGPTISLEHLILASQPYCVPQLMSIRRT